MAEDPAIVGSHEGFDYWLNRPFVTPAIRAELVNARLLVVPQEGFRNHEGPVFPVGTEELLAFLRQAAKELQPDICITDADYHELALHSDDLNIATLVVWPIASSLVASVIYDFIKKKLGKRLAKAKVKFTLVIDDKKAVRKIQYDGPAAEFGDSMQRAIKALDRRKK
jgi:hypothetical protein